MALERFKPAPLPAPPRKYDPLYFRQFIRVLEIYFSQLESITPNQAKSYRADNFFGGELEVDVVEVGEVWSTLLNTAQVSAEDTFSDEAILGATSATSLICNDAVFGTVMAGAVSANTLAGDGRRISTPYAQITSDVAQTAASATAAYAITFNTTEYAYRVALSASSRITLPDAGVYRLFYSCQFVNTSSTTDFVSIWLRKNGTDIPLSKRMYSIERNISAVDGVLAVTSFLLFEVAASDYVELIWNTSDTATSLQPRAAGASPTSPTTPAAVVSVDFVHEVPVPDVVVRPVSASAYGYVSDLSITTTRA